MARAHYVKKVCKDNKVVKKEYHVCSECIKSCKNKRYKYCSNYKKVK